MRPVICISLACTPCFLILSSTDGRDCTLASDVTAPFVTAGLQAECGEMASAAVSGKVAVQLGPVAVCP